MHDAVSGLSAFPLTPMNEDDVDETAFVQLVQRLSTSDVDSITVLGSTGSYAYLTMQQRTRLLRLGIEHAGTKPALVSIGALRTRDVLTLADDAQAAGAAGVLLAPVSYQPLRPHEVVGLYEDASAVLDLPIVVYDNPATTHFTFTDELYREIAALPHVASIKIPGVPANAVDAHARVQRLRDALPPGLTIGVSDDRFAALGLNAGCDGWYSVIAGTLPDAAVELIRAAQSGDAATATAISNRLQPMWDLFGTYGSLRVVAAVAAQLGLTNTVNLPRPLQPLEQQAQHAIAAILSALPPI